MDNFIREFLFSLIQKHYEISGLSVNRIREIFKKENITNPHIISKEVLYKLLYKRINIKKQLSKKGFNIDITMDFTEMSKLYNILIFADVNDPLYIEYRELPYGLIFCSVCNYICCSTSVPIIYNNITYNIVNTYSDKFININYNKQCIKNSNLYLINRNDKHICIKCENKNKHYNKYKWCLNEINLNPRLDFQHKILENDYIKFKKSFS